MASDQIENFIKVTVSTGYAAGATSIVLQAGQGAELPDPDLGHYNLVWWDATIYADPADDPNVEIVRATALATDTLTVTRAQESTADSSKNTGGSTYLMALAPTLKVINDVDPDERILQAAHGFLEGDVLYHNGTNYALAIATSATAASAVGIVSDVSPDGDYFTLKTIGRIIGLTGLTAGTNYYVSPTSAGDLTNVKPTTVGQFVRLVLMTDSTSSGYILPGKPTEIETSSVTVDDFTLKDNGGVLSTAPFILDNIMLNSLQIADNNSLTAGSMVDGYRDTYTDESGVNTSASTDEVFEGGSYRTPVATTANAETLKLLFNESDGSLEVADQSGQGHVITRNGGVTGAYQVANHYRYGSRGLYLENSRSQNISTPVDTDWSDLTGVITQDMTFEAWVKVNQDVGNMAIVCQNDGTNAWQISVQSTYPRMYFLITSGASFVVNSASYIDDNEWHHVMMVKDGGSPNALYSLYLDGHQIAGRSGSTITSGTSEVWFGRDFAGNFWDGYMDDIRISDTKRYSTVPIERPYLHYTCDENAASTVVNQFGSTPNTGVTVGGNTDTLHASGKVKDAFDFTGTQYIDFSLDVAGIASDTTGTVTAWINPNTLAGTFKTIWSVSDKSSLSTHDCIWAVSTAGLLRLNCGDGSAEVCIYDTTTSISANVWTHVALVQDGVLPKIYINGVSDTLTPVTATTPGAWLSGISGLDFGAIGSRQTSSTVDLYFDGRIDDPRYYSGVVLTQTEIESIRVAGVAGYYGLGSPSFTVPASALTDDVNTYFLCNFEPVAGVDLVDTSTGGPNSPHTINYTGGVTKPGITSPFGNAYVQFNNTTGDYLSIPDSDNWHFCESLTDSQTISFWARHSDDGSSQHECYMQQGAGNDQDFFRILKHANDWVDIQFDIATVDLFRIQGGVIPVESGNSWHFITVVKVGQDIALYVDGTQDGFAYMPSTSTANVGPMWIGERDTLLLDEYEMNGGIDDFHWNKANLFSATPIAQPYIQLTMNDNAASTVVIDTGTGGNNGTLNGTGPNTQDLSSVGKLPTGTPLALDFNGTDNFVNMDVVVGTIDGDTAGAVTAWINPDGFATSSVIFSVGDTVTQDRTEVFVFTGGQLRVIVQNVGVLLDVESPLAAISTGVWTHIAVSQDGISPKIYINGVDQTLTITTSTDLTAWNSNLPSPNNVRAGCLNFNGGGNSFFFDGKIDDLRYYRHALSQAQIDDIYNSGTGTESFALDTITVPVAEAVADANSVLLIQNGLDQSDSKHIPVFNGATGIAENFDVFGRGSLELHSSLSQYITVPGHADFDFTGDFNIDGWIKRRSLGSVQYLASRFIAGNNAEMDFYFDANDKLNFRTNDSVGGGANVGILATNLSVSDTDWHHVSALRSGGELAIYLDGGQVGSESGTVQDLSAGASLLGIGALSSGAAYFDGNIDDFRITDNNAFGAIPYFTPLLLQGEGTDEDTSAPNIGMSDGTVTFTGAKLDDGAPTGPKFNSTTSIFFDGTDDHVEMVDSSGSDFDIWATTSEDWTVDTWVNMANFTGIQAIWTHRTAAAVDSHYVRISGTDLQVFVRLASSNYWNAAAAHGMSVDAWNHIAYIKTGTDHGVYVNGTSILNTEITATGTITDNWFIGAVNEPAITDYYDGYMEQFRITRGNIFDASPIGEKIHLKMNDDAASLTVVNDGTLGNGAAQANTDTLSTTGKLPVGTPLGLTFDGSGDYIDLDSILSSVINDTAGTISAWINADTIGTYKTIFQFSDLSTQSLIRFSIAPAGVLEMRHIQTGGTVNFTIQGSTTLSTATWYHVAFTQDGYDPKLYVDGSVESETFLTTTDTTVWASNLSGTLDAMRVGSQQYNGGGQTSQFDGIIDDFRYFSHALTANQIGEIYNSGTGTETALTSTITVPTAASTTQTITVPTAAHTADANTMLLCHFDPGIDVATDLPTDLDDESPTGHTLTAVNGASVTGSFGTQSVAGRMVFDGVNDDIQFSDHSDWNLFDSYRNSWTMHLWVKPTALTGTHYIITQHEDTNNRWYLQRTPGNVNFGFVSGGVVDISMASGSDLTLNVWTHIAVVKVGDDSSPDVGLYINGLQVAYANQSDVADFASDLWVGQSGISSSWFVGEMDTIVLQPDLNALALLVNPTVGLGGSYTVPTAEPTGITTPGVMLLESVAVDVAAALPAPDTIKITIDLEDIDPTVVLNTDIIGRVSRDGGTTYTDATLAQTGQATNGRRLITDEVDVSAQPDPGAGNSDIIYQIQTYNDVQMRMHATSELWG